MAEQTGSGPRTPRRRHVWVDPRFLIGITLVAASVLGVFTLVSAADKTVEVLVARNTLSIGDQITAEDLAPRAVRLDQSVQMYLTRDRLPDDGLVVTRVIGRGELVPTSAVGDRAGLRFASIVVGVTGRLPASIEAGTIVDLWSAPALGAGEYGAPTVIVPSASVVRVIDGEGMIAGRDTVAVELLVPRNRTARVLEAVANEHAISLVPAHQPVRG